MSMSEEIDKQEEFVPIPGFPGYAANRLGQIMGRSGYLLQNLGPFPSHDRGAHRWRRVNAL